MSHRRHGNDNIRTGHLKCDRCRTRIELASIKQDGTDEIRSFECRHCGAVKSVRVALRPAPQRWSERSGDCSSC